MIQYLSLVKYALQRQKEFLKLDELVAERRHTGGSHLHLDAVHVRQPPVIMQAWKAY